MIAKVKSMGYSISRLRIDNDTVFMCSEFTPFCESKSIYVERTVPYAHWQLGRIERHWRTLTDGAKALLLYARLPDMSWGQVFLTMIYIRNRC